jgi:pimeloyl-ACP methyl ester carboxylesterase
MTKPSWIQTEPALLNVGHSRMSHWRVGSGPDLLFIHGWPLHAATFRELVPLLSERFTCHIVDLPGCGRSEWGPKSEIGIHAHVASLRKVVDQLALREFGVVAHDSGAVIARLLAADEPRVRALVIGNSEIPGHRPKLVELYVILAKLRLFRLATAPVLGFRFLRHSALGYKGCFHDVGRVEGEFMDWFVRPMLRDRRVALGQARLLYGFDWSIIDTLDRVHARIRAPVKLIWGAQDPFFPLERARRTLGQFAGGASLSALDPGKLFVHEEFPQAFAREARPFLEQALTQSVEEAAASPSSRSAC